MDDKLLALGESLFKKSSIKRLQDDFVNGRHLYFWAVCNAPVRNDQRDHSLYREFSGAGSDFDVLENLTNCQRQYKNRKNPLGGFTHHRASAQYLAVVYYFVGAVSRLLGHDRIPKLRGDRRI